MDGVVDAKQIRDHNRSKAHLEVVKGATSHVSGSDAAREWFCITCNLKMPAEATVVNAHNSSSEHARMARMTAEEHRDGPVLAAQQRHINGDKDAEPPKRKRVQK